MRGPRRLLRRGRLHVRRRARACSTSRTRARWRGRSPTPAPTTRTYRGRRLGRRRAAHRDDPGARRRSGGDRRRRDRARAGLRGRPGGAHRSWALGELGFDAHPRAAPGADRRRRRPRARQLGRAGQQRRHRRPQRARSATGSPVGCRCATRAGRLGRTGSTDAATAPTIPADGHVVTANERRGPESDAIGTVFAAPYRAARLHALLDGRTGLTARRLRGVPQRRAPADGADGDRAGAGRVRRLRRRDGRPARPRPPATRPSAARSSGGSARSRCSPSLFDPPPEHQHEEIFAPWLNATYRIALVAPAPRQRDAAGHRPFGIDLVAHARAALAEVDAAGAPATWGDTHVTDPVHWFGLLTDHDYDALPRLPLSGDADCVRCCVSYPAHHRRVQPRVGRPLRLGPRRPRPPVAGSSPPVPTGCPATPHHHDQLPLWAAGELAPIVTDWDALTEISR